MSESRFEQHLDTRRPLLAKARPSFLLRASEVGPKRSREAFIFRVPEREVLPLIEDVVNPFFHNSAQLYSTEFNRTALDVLHRGGKPAAGGGEPSQPRHWIEYPACVKFWDKKGGAHARGGGKAVRDGLLTPCVFPAARTKIAHVASPERKDREVQHSLLQQQQYYQITFWLLASRERKEGEGGGWVPCTNSNEEWLRVEMLLHQLISYLKLGLQHAQQGPFDVGPRDQSKVVMHLCEQPKCCCPWHLQLGTKSQNLQRVVAQPPQKRSQQSGKFQSTHYATGP
jgi:hypothetical protein